MGAGLRPVWAGAGPVGGRGSGRSGEPGVFMGVRVIESYPGSPAVGLFMAALLGVLLLVVAMVAAVVPVVFGLGLLLDAGSSSADNDIDGQTLAWVAGLLVLAVVG